MKIIVNNVLPPKGFLAINLFGIIFSKRELTSIERNHEAIHTAQMKELLYIGFYVWYVIEWVFNLFKWGDRKQAYRNISFEREAYKYQLNLTYLNSRKHYAFLINERNN